MGRTVEPSNATDIRALLDREEVVLHFPQDDLGPYLLRRVKTSQCKVACPLGTDVKGYVGLIAAGQHRKSLDLIKETNPFPAICGRVCMHPCEPECRRGEVDAPVSIRALKRFVADYELKNPSERIERDSAGKAAQERVAIVGSGPAGLTAAGDLARWGYGVTVFEALPVAGGMLSVGIPPFRLPRDVIQAEIGAIADLGVDIRTKKKITDPRRLLQQGYKAVFMATGAHKGLKLGLPGEDLQGSLDALTFLREVHLGREQRPGDRVVVIGAGYAALDSARTALRLGSRRVDLVYRRSKGELPYSDLAREAQREGAKLHYHVAPVRILGRKGRVTGVACVKMRSEPADQVGRRQPTPIQGSEFVLSADAVIFAIHQEPDLSFLPRKHGFEITPWNTLMVEPETLATSKKGIFAGGDAVSGPKSVIEAIAVGHKAAASIHRYIRAKEAGPTAEAAGEGQSEVIIEDWVPERRDRLRVLRESPKSWAGRFQEVERLPSEDRARREADRCLMCGPCDECEQCIAGCEKKLLVLSAPQATGQEVLARIPWISDRFPDGNGPWQVLIEGPGGISLQALASPVVCDVWEELCRGCAECAQVCEYEARKMVSRPNGVVVSEVDQTICRGCGACVTVCPTGASIVSHFTEARLTKALEEMLVAPSGRKGRKKAAGPQIVGFACNWSAYPLLEGDGLQLSANLNVIRVMCLGSVNPGVVLRAFELGADGVLMLGCSPEKCHYSFGNRVAETQLEMTKKLMYTLGIERERLRLEVISSGERAKLTRIVRRFANKVSKLGPNPLSS
jgi:NADPH-dependent glutamate synthase beta subunit-like oxidoreductase/coenzyme F420-reducing hydrogenase delta subunit/ferredoxin